MEPEETSLRQYEPQLDPAFSQSSSLPQILSLTTASWILSYNLQQRLHSSTLEQAPLKIWK